jgi:uncharacterized protein (TIGR02246 family)
MSRVISATLCALLVTVANGAAFAGPKEGADAKAIREVLAQYERALNAADTSAIAQLYTSDGVQMAPDAPAAVGRESVTTAYAGTFKAITLNLKFTVDEVKPLGDGSALLRSHSTGTVKVNGADRPAGPASFKELFVLSKAGGQWRISHYSFSAAPTAKAE